MLCPFCIDNIRKFKAYKSSTLEIGGFQCPQCQLDVPTEYVREYAAFPPVVLGLIGLYMHGKTTLLTSLLHMLQCDALTSHWPDFCLQPVTAEDRDTLRHGIHSLRTGILPPATPKVLPTPTMIRVANIPRCCNATLLCFDTSGNTFDNPRDLVHYAPYIRGATVAFIVISPSDLSEPARDMQGLLETYVEGTRLLSGDSRKQHLLVVFTKGDRFTDGLHGQWLDLKVHLAGGTTEGLHDMHGYISRMATISRRLKEYTSRVLHAGVFIDVAAAHFKSVELCMVSALGMEASGARLSTEAAPKRVLDPLLWVMKKSKRPYIQLW